METIKLSSITFKLLSITIVKPQESDPKHLNSFFFRAEEKVAQLHFWPLAKLF